MRGSKLHILPALAVVLILAAGCGDDDALAPSTANLSQAESIAIVNDAIAAMMSAMYSGMAPSVAPTAAPAATVVPFEFSNEATVECPAGGEVTASMSASGDMNQGSGNMTMSGTASYIDCAREGDERLMTLNGQLTHTGSLSVEESAMEGSFRFRGAIEVDLDPGEGGSCSFDITVSFAGESGSVTGNACGHDYNISA